MTIRAQRIHNVSRLQNMPALGAAGNGADVAGHGVLVKRHSGWRRTWWRTRAWEGNGGCSPTAAIRTSNYPVLPRTGRA